MKLSRNRKSIYIVNKNIFLEENDISFYLLGAYMTDGNISDRKRHICFSISSKDQDWIISIKNLICASKPIYKSKNTFILVISNIEIINWFLSYGCVPRKSKNLELIKTIPQKYIPDFVRGCIDGDGSISFCNYIKRKNNKTYQYKKATVYLCSASLKFLEQIKNLIPTDINCNIINCGITKSCINNRLIIGTCNMYRLQFNDKYAKLFLKWCYYDTHQLSLYRKYLKAKDVFNFNKWN